MNSDYVFKGKSQLALQAPDWAKFSAGAGKGAGPVAPHFTKEGVEASHQTSEFAAAVDAHAQAYEAVKHTAGSAKHAGTKAAAATPHRYLAAEAETERLNRMSSSPARIVEDDSDASTVVPSSDGTEQVANKANNEIGEDGSLYPERNKASASKMNASNHSGSNKKTTGPDVDNVDYTFEDFLDTINPLQQIPVVNMIYRQLTGDKISGVAQVMGSALFWGPTGIVTGAIDAIFEQEKGGDMGETIMASILGTDTPNGKNLPSRKLGAAPDTMLADAQPKAASKTRVAAHDVAPTAAPSAKVAASQPSPASKQPFGGIMGNEQPAPVANVVENPEATRADAVQADAVPADGDETADDAVGAQDTSKTAALPTATPSVKAVPHGPVENDGHKMYSLAGIVRHPSVPSHMPPREAPDTRLKNYGKMTASATPPTPDAAASLLGLQKPAAAIAATPTLDDAELPETRLPDPGFSAPLNMGNDARTPSGNAIPAQLIQDMMLLNMQKYQNDLKSGTLRGSSLDVNG